MDLTEAQQAACRARGNVLVVAGAGTGKTRTLVERCLTCLLEERPRVSLDELLLVTFTEAAAAEMRQRVRARLEEQAARQPQDRHWSEQLALFETAQIGTLHAFCLQLVRRHFYQLGLDPQLAVLPEEESRLMAEETLDGLLEKYYGGRGLTAEAVQELIQVQGRGRDQPLRSLVLKLHNYSQTQPNPAGWLEEQTSAFSEAEPRLWRRQ
jgi:ATP-dependent helicase/nuclease subunit A